MSASFISSVSMRDRARVVELGAGDRGPVDLGLHHAAVVIRWRHPHVVDEPGAADPGGQQQAGVAGDGAERDERGRVDDLGVVEPGQRLGGDDVGHAPAQASPGARRRPGRRRPRPGPGAGPWRPRALVGRQVGVAAGEGQPVGVAHRRAADHLDRQGQVGRHPADDRQLLEVLLAEVGPARPGQVEQLGDDGGHAREVAGPAVALQVVGQPGHRRPGRPAASGEHLARRRGEHDRRPAPGGQRHVGVRGRGGRRRGPRPARTAAG